MGGGVIFPRGTSNLGASLFVISAGTHTFFVIPNYIQFLVSHKVLSELRVAKSEVILPTRCDVDNEQAKYSFNKYLSITCSL